MFGFEAVGAGFGAAVGCGGKAAEEGQGRCGRAERGHVGRGVGDQLEKVSSLWMRETHVHPGGGAKLAEGGFPMVSLKPMQIMFELGIASTNSRKIHFSYLGILAPVDNWSAK